MIPLSFTRHGAQIKSVCFHYPVIILFPLIVDDDLSTIWFTRSSLYIRKYLMSSPLTVTSCRHAISFNCPTVRPWGRHAEICNSIFKFTLISNRQVTSHNRLIYANFSFFGEKFLRTLLFASIQRNL